MCRYRIGGASRDRTDDLIVANDALSQLSYSPTSYAWKVTIHSSNVFRSQTIAAGFHQSRRQDCCPPTRGAFLPASAPFPAAVNLLNLLNRRAVPASNGNKTGSGVRP